MAYRSRTTEIDERDYYGPPRRGGSEVEEIDYRRRSVTRSPPGRARGPVREYDEVDVRVREREGNRAPNFLREDARRAEAGPMVLRQREVETFDRVARSPSPVRERPLRRPRSVSPPPFQDRDRGSRTMVVEEERIVTSSPSCHPPQIPFASAAICQASQVTFCRGGAHSHRRTGTGADPLPLPLSFASACCSWPDD